METLNKRISQHYVISPNWQCIKTLDELVSDAKFIFINKGFEGSKPRIVLNTPINGIDCIEIGFDRYGLITEGETIFNNNWGELIIDSSQNYIDFIDDFLYKNGGKEFRKYITTHP